MHMKRCELKVMLHMEKIKMKDNSWELRRTRGTLENCDTKRNPKNSAKSSVTLARSWLSLIPSPGLPM